jgi:RHS repeat-associated protein
MYDPGGYTYDNAGDVSADGVNGYLYDAEGRICAVNTGSGWTGYLYDAAGNRVAKGSIQSWSCDITTNGFSAQAGYVVGPSGEQLTEVDASNNWVHTNVYAGGKIGVPNQLAGWGEKLIGTYDSVGLHFHIDDPLGTRRAQVSSAGVLEATYQSLPFGDGYAASGTAEDPTENHFTGKERDTESGNDYFGARYYNSNIGRFLSPDWSAKEDPVPYAHLDNPQSLNLYSYVQNNPLAKPDLDGHGCPPDCGDPTAPTNVAPPTPSLWDRFVDANVAVLHYAAVQYDELTHPTRNCPDCSMQIVPLGMPEATPSLATRAQEIQGTLGAVTQTKVTTAVGEAVSADGSVTRLVGSSEGALRPAQRAALQPGEVAAKGQAGTHAEVNVLNAAKENGQTLTSVAPSRASLSRLLCDNEGEQSKGRRSQ